MKLFIAQINPTVGDVEKNSRLIVKAIEQAKEAQASLVVFPQMALTGYPPHDLLRNRAFTAAISEAWHTIAEACQGLKAIVGSPIVCQEDEEETLYNGAVLLSHTEKAEIIPLQASALHDHSWFAASDYFNNGSAIASAITCEDYKVILSIDDEILDEEFASLAQQEKQSGNKQILAINLAARPFIFRTMETACSFIATACPRIGSTHFGSQLGRRPRSDHFRRRLFAYFQPGPAFALCAALP